MPKFVVANLGVVQTTAVVNPADVDPPYWIIDPAVSVLEHNRIVVRAAGFDNQVPLLDYYLATYTGGVPSAANVVNGVGADGVTPLDQRVALLQQNRNEVVELTLPEAVADTVYPLIMVVTDGTNPVSFVLGASRTPEGPATRFNFRDEGQRPHADWLPFILPYVDGVPERFVFQVLNEVIGEFLEKAQLWRLIPPLVTTVDGQESYEAEIPANALVVKAEEVRLNRALLYPNSDGRALEGSSMCGYVRNNNRFLIFPIPNANEELSFVLKLKPTHDATACEQFLFEDWRNVIVAGVLSKLYAMVAEPWFSAELAAMKAREFNQGKNRGWAQMVSNDDGQPFKASGNRVIRSRRGYVNSIGTF